MVTVKFLGAEYAFPEEVREYYLYWCKFNEISNRFKKLISNQMHRGINPEYILEDGVKVYHDLMYKEGMNVISMLAELKIYDVTVDELVENNVGFGMVTDVLKKTLEEYLRIMKEIESEKIDRVERAYQNASSNITGTGVSIWTNSFSTAFVHSMIESRTLKNQIKKAENEYNRALNSINSTTEYKRVNMLKTELFDVFYPGITKACGVFVEELMLIFLRALKLNDIFDYTKVSDLDLVKSKNIMKNINHLEDKEGPLKAAFEVCPYNEDVYVYIAKMGFCDQETFRTAEYYKQEKAMLDCLMDFCENNADDVVKIENSVSSLAYYEKVPTAIIYSRIFKEEYNNIVNSYEQIKMVVQDESLLPSWLRGKLFCTPSMIVDGGVTVVLDKLQKYLDKIVTDERFNQLIALGVADYADLNLDNQQEKSLVEIKQRYFSLMRVLIESYIQTIRSESQAEQDQLNIIERDYANDYNKQKREELDEKKQEELQMDEYYKEMDQLRHKKNTSRNIKITIVTIFVLCFISIYAFCLDYQVKRDECFEKCVEEYVKTNIDSSADSIGVSSFEKQKGKGKYVLVVHYRNKNSKKSNDIELQCQYDAKNSSCYLYQEK